MRRVRKLALWTCLLAASAVAQTTPATIAPIWDQPIQPPDVEAYQLRGYIAKRTPRIPLPPTAEQWATQAKQLRAGLLKEVVCHGWPREWVEAEPKFEDLAIAGSGPGYRIRKLRYEIVPGFQSTAILYDPDVIRGKIRAILNVNGHDPAGKAAEYKQKRCINQARQGIFSKPGVDRIWRTIESRKSPTAEGSMCRYWNTSVPANIT